MESSGNASRDIINSIRMIAGKTGLKSAEFVTGTVVSVNEASRQCSVNVVLGTSNMTLTEVNLSSESNDGFIQVPSVGSSVLLVIMPDNNSYSFIFSDIDKIICVIDNQNKFTFNSNGFIFNGGLNGGLIKIDNLTSSINTMILSINANLTAISAAIASLGGSYAPAPLIPFVKTNYENTKITH